MCISIAFPAWERNKLLLTRLHQGKCTCRCAPKAIWFALVAFDSPNPRSVSRVRNEVGVIGQLA
jgi:hypothetical protein